MPVCMWKRCCENICAARRRSKSRLPLTSVSPTSDNETGIEIGGRLFSDALSERGGPATSYLAMFRHNLETLITALEQVDAS